MTEYRPSRRSPYSVAFSPLTFQKHPSLCAGGVNVFLGRKSFHDSSNRNLQVQHSVFYPDEQQPVPFRSTSTPQLLGTSRSCTARAAAVVATTSPINQIDQSDDGLSKLLKSSKVRSEVPTTAMGNVATRHIGETHWDNMRRIGADHNAQLRPTVQENGRSSGYSVRTSSVRHMDPPLIIERHQCKKRVLTPRNAQERSISVVGQNTSEPEDKRLPKGIRTNNFIVLGEC